MNVHEQLHRFEVIVEPPVGGKGLTAINRLEEDPRALVFLNGLDVKPDDSFVAYLQARWHEVSGVGPPILMGGQIYKLYAPGPAG